MSILNDCLVDRAGFRAFKIGKNLRAITQSDSLIHNLFCCYCCYFSAFGSFSSFSLGTERVSEEAAAISALMTIFLMVRLSL